ncbi:MAG: protein-tyrosine kinase [Desulforhopalus sp.]|jgi:protein-tyrosine kinase
MNTIERALLKKKQDSAELEKNRSENEATAVKPQQQTTIERAETKTVSEQVPLKSPELNTGQTIEIDLDKLEEKGFVSTNARRQLINEEYRAIKRKILGNAFGALSKSLKNSNIIMVTSTNPGEGKTFTAVNLALSIALEKDKTVLLVDADVLRPNVMRTLEMENREGLMEYLLGEKNDISEIMCKTNLENLRIIPAGKSHHLSTELLASEKMYDAVEEFANRYPDRVVIVDTPPLLGINETAILANLAGQAIVVAEEGKTKLADIQKAVSQLHPEMAIGFVVNKAQKVNNDEHGYGYYYAGAN